MNPVAKICCIDLSNGVHSVTNNKTSHKLMENVTDQVSQLLKRIPMVYTMLMIISRGVTHIYTVGSAATTVKLKVNGQF